ncbi:MAG TPA: Stk1 family PASTA domain-containing Ser/Thr kinase [Candidatus Avipropionibacterium avicola]|uniref:non-specific serine/threonine protein kinase n=1 Tax=Candidatus Avipropionibacterium avicola TaxID=2840701 RepID=A0A9D1GZY9_9ACTN|nr:Stk1 family PASTA domain-containing Ser/Thr kinase [Candidatus Avipropionibacterium avicola]
MTDDTRDAGGNAQSPRRVGDRYEIGELLGRGGMAEVHRAIDSRLNRPVAVKQLRTDLAGDPIFQARFRREAQAAAGLNHPTIVAVYDTGEEPDPVTGVRIPYIVMELVEGVTLRDVLRDGRKILPERALELSAGVLDALSYSHRAGIVHRDIKPANVMLTPAGDVKVMDFGIARAVADTQSTMTQTAAVIGTAQYLSPEQARGETVDARSDIYSAGCLLYELLVGRPPFVGDSPVSVAYQHVREEPKPPSQHDSEITPEMDAVVMRSLAKDPNDRYQSARQMKDDLQRLLQGQKPIALASGPASSPTPAEAPTAVLVPDHQPAAPAAASLAESTRGTEPVDPVAGDGVVAETEDDEAPPKRKGATIALVILLALALITVGIAIWWVNNDAEPPPPPPSSSAPVQMVTVPSVISFSEEQARNRLEGMKLEVKVKEVAGDADSTVGQVIDQTPPEGEEVPVGSTVTITVNVGPESATIPQNLVGMSESEAKDALEDAGFTNISTQDATDEDPGTEKGEVLAVDPGEGESLALDSEIVLTVATGQGSIPDLSGMTRERAQQEAKDRGFEVEFEEEEVEDPNDVNTVISQDPGSGDKADWGSTIKLVIGIAQTPTDPPTTEPTEPGDSSPPPTDEPTDEESTP